MKKIFSLFFVALFGILAFSSCQKEEVKPDNNNNGDITGQTSGVNTTIVNADATRITASFAMKPNTNEYSIMIVGAGEITQFARMFGFTVEGYVNAWGLHYTTDTTYTWTEMEPETDYYIYVLSFGSDTILDSTAVRTTINGDGGTASVTITVSEIGDTTARVIVTPNTSTAGFTDMIIEKGVFETLPLDTVMSYLYESPYWYYETDNYLWYTLNPGTDYYALGLAYNANHEWGPLAREEFRTNGSSNAQNISISIYPNPTADLLHVEAPKGAQMQILDMKGNMMMNSTESTMNISKLPHGLYMLRITVDGHTTIRPVCKR